MAVEVEAPPAAQGNANRGGIRVSDEPEKPGFRFRIPFYPPKTRVNPDFRVFMLDFPPKNRVKPVFRSIRNSVLSKCHYPPHPYSISSLHRVYEEKLMRLVGATEKLVNEDKYHLGYEVLFSTHSSPMVPKESPIKVF